VVLRSVVAMRNQAQQDTISRIFGNNVNTVL
jgi:hypothetical protein